MTSQPSTTWYEYTFSKEDPWINLPSPLNDNWERSLIGSPMITGREKLLKTVVEPFNAFHHSFRQDCLESSKILVIGYSFSDGYINNSIKNGMKDNDKQSLAFITKETDFNNHLNNILSEVGLEGKPNSNRFKYFNDGFEDFLRNNIDWNNI
jgi:hypothetical protein